MNYLILVMLLNTVENRPSIENQNDEAFLIGQMLRCPVCQGMPVSESPSQMAQDMMANIREMLAQGKNRDEIYQYFVERYGQWVLLKPKAEGINLSLWFLPIIVFIIGIIIITRFLVKKPLDKKEEEQIRVVNKDKYLDELRREIQK